MAEKIEVRINEVLGFTTRYHQYIVYTTDVGGPNERQLVAEAGPGYPGAFSGTLRAYTYDLASSPKPQLQPGQSVTIRTGADLSAEWATIQQVIQETNQANLDYTIRGGLGGVDGLWHWQNSNSFVSTALYAIGERQAPEFRRPNGSFYSTPGALDLLPIPSAAPRADSQSDGFVQLANAFNEHDANGYLVRTTAAYENGERTVSSYSRGPDGTVAQVDTDYFNKAGQIHGHQAVWANGTRVDTAFDVVKGAPWAATSTRYDNRGHTDF